MGAQDALYNLTNISGVNNPLDFVTNINSLADYIPGTMMVMTVFVLTFMAFKNYEPKTSFAASSFLTALVALMMRLVGLVPDHVLIISSVVAALSVTLLLISGPNE